MKKIIILSSFVMLLSVAGRAQFSSFGLQVGGGYSYLSDDIVSHTGTYGFNFGAFMTFDFSKWRSVLANRLYLQSGLSLIHRGGTDEAVFVVSEGVQMTQTGSIDAWYLQIPVLAALRLELPLRKSGHYFNAFVGPAVSIGLWGDYKFDSKDSGHNNAEYNYQLSDDKVFDHITRFDVSAIAGIGYQYKNWFARIWVDYGFLAIDEGKDILRELENTQTGENKSTAIPNANIVTYMLCVGYQFPIRH